MNDPQKRYQDYLDFVEKYKDNIGYKGDYTKGEIEIVNDINLFALCEEGAKKLMIDSGTSEEDASERSRIGVRDENRWGVSICQPLRLPDGSYTAFVRPISWGTLDSGTAGVVAVATLTDGRFILLNNYRFNVTSWSLEFPRGGKDPKTSILNMLKKELSEEIGAEVIGEPIKIGEVFPDSGFLASKVDVFKATVELTGEVSHEVTEAIKNLVFLTKEELIEKVKQGEIKDSYTLSALTLLNNE